LIFFLFIVKLTGYTACADRSSQKLREGSQSGYFAECSETLGSGGTDITTSAGLNVYEAERRIAVQYTNRDHTRTNQQGIYIQQ